MRLDRDGVKMRIRTLVHTRIRKLVRKGAKIRALGSYIFFTIAVMLVAAACGRDGFEVASQVRPGLNADFVQGDVDSEMESAIPVDSKSGHLNPARTSGKGDNQVTWNQLVIDSAKIKYSNDKQEFSLDGTAHTASLRFKFSLKGKEMLVKQSAALIQFFPIEKELPGAPRVRALATCFGRADDGELHCLDKKFPNEVAARIDLYVQIGEQKFAEQIKTKDSNIAFGPNDKVQPPTKAKEPPPRIEDVSDITDESEESNEDLAGRIVGRPGLVGAMFKAIEAQPVEKLNLLPIKTIPTGEENPELNELSSAPSSGQSSGPSSGQSSGSSSSSAPGATPDSNPKAPFKETPKIEQVKPQEMPLPDFKKIQAQVNSTIAATVATTEAATDVTIRTIQPIVEEVQAELPTQKEALGYLDSWKLWFSQKYQSAKAYLQGTAADKGQMPTSEKEENAEPLRPAKLEQFNQQNLKLPAAKSLKISVQKTSLRQEGQILNISDDLLRPSELPDDTEKDIGIQFPSAAIPPLLNPWPAKKRAQPIEQARGFYSDGELRNATVLNPDKSKIVLVYPKLQLNYGTEGLVHLVEKVGILISTLLPGNKLKLSVMSLEKGGSTCAVFGYSCTQKSHHNGLDVDMGYLTNDPVDEHLLVKAVDSNGNFKNNIQMDAQWQVFKNVIRSKSVSRFFVNTAIKRAFCDFAKANGDPNQEVSQRLQAYKDHTNVFHIRLVCPETSPLCINDEPNLEKNLCP